MLFQHWVFLVSMVGITVIVLSTTGNRVAEGICEAVGTGLLLLVQLVGIILVLAFWFWVFYMLYKFTLFLAAV